MIEILDPLPVGNAVRAIVAPPEGATRIRLLRKSTNDISGPTDPNAVTVLDGQDTFGIDTTGLQNGVTYFYAPFYEVAGQWVADAVGSATPNATYGYAGPDVQELVRLRLEAGLAVEVLGGRVPSSKGLPNIVVQTAPSLYDQTPFPVVTVHLQGEAPTTWGIGMEVAPDLFDDDSGLWTESIGALNHVDLLIVGFAVANADTRILLRKAIQRVLMANRAVFDAAGMVNLTWSLSDAEDTESYAAPVYMTMVNFGCDAPCVVTGTCEPIESVSVTVETT